MNSRLITLLNPYVAAIAILFSFSPLLLLWIKKLSKEKAYTLIAIYWLLNGSTNLPEWMGQANNFSLLNEITLIYNLIDAPLVLLILYFSSSGFKKTMLLYLLISYIIFECIMIFWKGFNFDSSAIIIGVGGSIILIFSVWGVADFFQKIEHSSFETTMGFIYAAFIFEYSLSIVTFISNYLNFKKETVDVNLFVYYLSVISATLLTSFGLWRYARPKMAEENNFS
ncbi:MAG: hypothetical protein JST75_06175 [Bacteroidetes bacterium]|nr:hypothetical protein [Bacteroidota bacterium]